MFSESIQQVSNFTRPIHTILRTHLGKKVIPSCATLFFVNEEGYAVTCKHVINMLAAEKQVNDHYVNFKTERSQLPKDSKFKNGFKQLVSKYQYVSETVVQVKNTFVNCVDKMDTITTMVHPHHDLAIIKFDGYTALHYNGYAKFLKDSSKIKQGNSLCRLGYPFPEFTNYTHNESVDDIQWTTTGNNSSPTFPLDGMVTRFLADGQGKIMGIEMSTPGLIGQSGGPLFDGKGIVYGMQFSTKNLQLGFDVVDKEILVNNTPKTISDYSFIHLGQCIHVDIIKEFLKEKKVKFYEE